LARTSFVSFVALSSLICSSASTIFMAATSAAPPICDTYESKCGKCRQKSVTAWF
jgi:hypothetical protein